MLKHLGLLCISLAISACSSMVPVSCPPPLSGDVIYVVEQGWHVEIGIPVEELDENMSFFKGVFPNAKVILFGFGKKTFFIAPAESVSEYLLGPFPGPALIQVVGLNVTPTVAYPPENTVTLVLPTHGGKLLSAAIWKDLVKADANKPQWVAQSSNPSGLFYAAHSEYNLMYTCNTWVADMLYRAGLPIPVSHMIFSNQVMNNVTTIAEAQCQVLR